MALDTTKIKICVTGGPSGGKTTLIEALQKDLSDKISIVPEAASILYRGGFPRHPTPVGKRHAQKAIYFTQIELEDLVVEESVARVIICDRGSLDSLAYWPGNAAEYFHAFQTNKDKEFARYNWVIHLDTAANHNFDTTNPVRVETHSEAVELNNKVKLAWQGHPQRLIITHCADFFLKLARARKAIAMIMAGSNLKDIEKALAAVSI